MSAAEAAVRELDKARRNRATVDGFLLSLRLRKGLYTQRRLRLQVGWSAAQPVPPAIEHAFYDYLAELRDGYDARIVELEAQLARMEELR